MQRVERVMFDIGSISVLTSIGFCLVVLLTGSVEVSLIVILAYSAWLWIGAMNLQKEGWHRSVQGSIDADIWTHWAKDTVAIALWPMVKNQILTRAGKKGRRT